MENLTFNNIDDLYKFMNDRQKEECINSYNDTILDILEIERNTKESITYLWSTRMGGTQIKEINTENDYYDYWQREGFVHEYMFIIDSRENITVKTIK